MSPDQPGIPAPSGASERPTLLLIHGAWAGPWVWDSLLDPLAALGWEATALALPGDGFHRIAANDVTVADYERCITEAIDAADGPVALVGHSGGGMLVTLGATLRPDAVTHGIWIAGFLLPDGRTFDEIDAAIAGPGRQIGVGPHIVASSDGRTTTVAPEPAIRHFFHDAPPDVAAAAAQRLTPQPVAGARMETRAGPRFDALEKLYLLATDDRSVLPAAQRLMCDAVAGLTVVDIDTGHAPQLIRPEDVVAILDQWLAGGVHTD